MRENNSWMKLLLLVEGFGGNDDHPPPPTTTLFPTTTTICHPNLQEQENTNQNLLPTDLLPNISLPSHLYHHHLPLELLHYPVCCTTHGCKFKFQHFTDAVVHFSPGFVLFRKIKCRGRWFPWYRW